MKISAALVLLGACSIGAFSPNNAARGSRSMTSPSVVQMTATTSDAFTKPERVVMDDLPTVYVYDHCPFCVRVRVALGLKNVKHNIHFMANDDIPTPTKLVGKKIAPIFVSYS
jgi:glutaredoxin 2